MSNVETLSHLVGYPFKTSQQDLAPRSSYVSFVKNPRGKTAKEQFIDNPVVTDETLREQCELKYLFANNPDLTGLSLVSDDTARDERLSSISVEDFMPARDHYDIFDIAEFVEKSKEQFRKLPAELRMKYNNSAIEFCNALDKNYSSTIADMQQYFNPVLPSSPSNSRTPAVGSPENSKPEVVISQTPDSLKTSS